MPDCASMSEDGRKFTVENVTIVDGTGAPAVVGSVDVVADRIDAIRSTAENVSARGSRTGGQSLSRVIDGNGLVLSPGFIDVHTHDEWALLLSPDHGCKTLQGVTSIVVGNCGVSAIPSAANQPVGASFDRLRDYFDAIEHSPVAVNVAALAGHGSMRTAVMGLRTNRRPTRAELDELGQLTRQALDDGAIGLSSGLAYEPGRYSEPDELIELTRIVADAGGIYTTHMRDEGSRLLDSIDESIDVAERAGVALQISHLKAAGPNNWGTVRDALARIDAAAARGVDVMADQYPYCRGSSLLEQVVSAGALDGPSPFGTITTDQILVAAAPANPHWEGHTITEIAAAAGVDPREMADRIIEAEGRSCIVVLDIMSEDDVRTVMSHAAVMVGSDGIPAGDKPHPRLGHTFPRVLGRYVREAGVLGLEEAIHRMTQLPAERFGFVDRGVIRPGALADLVLFDPTTVVDTGTYAEPNTVPAGIAGVWVNGTQVVDGGVVTGRHPGRVVRGRHNPSGHGA